MPSKAQHLSFIYEAGPCGDWLYQYLSKQGYDGGVVAPALIRQQPGAWVKPDRRDTV